MKRAGIIAALALTSVFADSCAAQQPAKSQVPHNSNTETPKAADDKSGKPLVTETPDGKITIQKNVGGKKGLVIPPQVVYPES